MYMQVVNCAISGVSSNYGFLLIDFLKTVTFISPQIQSLNAKCPMQNVQSFCILSLFSTLTRKAFFSCSLIAQLTKWQVEVLYKSLTPR